MLEPHEKYAFDSMVTQLRADDPAFVRHLAAIEHPRRHRRLALAVLLWTAAPLCILLGGWTGLIMAVVASAYGAMLTSKHRPDTDRTTTFSWWQSSPRRRPGASL